MTAEPSEFALLCPHCGEQNPPEFPVCWSCQGDLPEVAVEARVQAVPERAVVVEPALTAGRRKRLLLELAVVLLVVWLPWPVSGIWNALDPAPPRGLGAEIRGLLLDVGALALLCYLAWLDGDWRRRLGLGRLRPVRDALVAFGVFAAFFVANVAALMLAWFVGLEEPPEPMLAFEPDSLWIAPFSFLSSAALEEVFYRAYLWSHLTELTRRPVLSIAISALLFSLAHVYPPEASIAIFFGGCVLGVIFWRLRSLWGLVVGHWLLNVWITFGPAY